MKNRVFSFFTVFTIVCIITISPKLSHGFKNKGYFNQEFVRGQVVEIVEENIMRDPIIEDRYRGSQEVMVKMLEGEDKGKEYRVYNSLGSLSNNYVRVGDKGIFTIRETKGRKVAWYFNPKRDNYLYILGGIFAAGLLIFGRLKGIKSLLALTFTGTMVIGVLIPMIFAGYSPVIWSVVVMAVVTLVSFILIGGFERKTYSAIIGTVAGITLAGILTLTFGSIMNLSGINMSGGEQLLYIAENYNIKIKGLLFASILIASLGAIMDVAMSIASSANEIYEKNPEIGGGELFVSLMNIGRDVMGTMTNTLILAFAGSSLPTIMMIWGYDMQYQQFINIPAISIEIMQGLAGSIGIIATVPLTALVSTLFIKRDNREEKE